MSILLAMAAATVALTLFFRFKAHWDDGWLKRALCAFALAAAVSAMHYTGMAGTKYRVRADFVNQVASLGDTKEYHVIIAASVMCAFFLLLSVGITVVDAVIAKKNKQNARKVVICSATFNKQGQLLVKEDGTLPMVVIETPMRHAEVLNALDRRQSTFQWLYSVSWNWDMVSDFLTAITTRLFLLEAPPTQSHGSSFLRRLTERRLSGEDARGTEGSPQALVDFRDRFIDAAGQLAVQLDIPFQKIGVLYDQVMPTGTRRAAEQAAREAGISLHSNSSQAASNDEDVGRRPPSIFAEGEKEHEGAMLFLVRQISEDSTRETEERYLQRGYRLTDVRFLGSHLANQYAVPKKDMEAWLGRIKMYAKRGTRPVVQPGPAVYVGLFGVRASTSLFGGLETLVYGFARHQIPAYRLPKVEGITPQIRYWVKLLDRMTLEDAQETCHREANLATERLKSLSAVRSSREVLRGTHDDDAEDEERQIVEESTTLDSMAAFQRSLGVALEALDNSMRFYPQLKATARLSADILEVPSSLDGSTPPAQMIVVQAVLPDERADLHKDSTQVIDAGHAVPTSQVTPTVPFVYVPYSLFSKAQMMLIRGRQAEQFEGEVVAELRTRYPLVHGVRSCGDVNDEKSAHMTREWTSEAAAPQSMIGRFVSLFHPHREGAALTDKDVEAGAVELTSTPTSPRSMHMKLDQQQPAIRAQHSLDWTTIQTLDHAPRMRASTNGSAMTTKSGNSAGQASLGIRRFLGPSGAAQQQQQQQPPSVAYAPTTVPASSSAGSDVVTAAAIPRLRPRVPDVEPRRHRVAQDTSVSGSNGSDDWMARRLSEIERAPGGSALLGVDW